MDFGREFIGHFEAVIEAPAGTRVDITYGEEFWKGRIRASFRADGYEIYFFTDSYILGNGKNHVGNLFEEHGGRYVQLVFRNISGDVTIHSASVLDQRYPYSRRGEFSCSDPLLNKIWNICRETLESSTSDVFLDCPWREHAFWVNDLIIENRSSLAMFGREEVHKRAFTLAFSQQREDGWVPAVAPTPMNSENPDNILPATNLFLFLMLDDYLMTTGDVDTVKEFMPNLERILSAVEREKEIDGLVRAPYDKWNFYDWGFELNSISFNRQKESMFNSLYVCALRSYMKLAETVLWKFNRAELEERINRVRVALESFISSASGLIEDPAIFACDKTETMFPSKLSSQLSLSFALRSGVWDDEHKKRFLNAIRENHILEPELYLYGFVLYELSKSGHTENALNRIRKNWGNFVSLGYATFPEAGIYKKGREAFRNSGSLCHGFTTYPAVFLQTEILGVEPLKPGYTEFSVSPKPCDLQYASGKIPVLNRVIEVNWKRENNLLKVCLTVPEDCVAVLADERRFTQGIHTFTIPL